MRAAMAAVLFASLAAIPGFAQQPAPLPSGPPAVPVSIAVVTRKNVPLMLRGLGTVQALQAVQLRTRVDGTLMRLIL